MVLINNKFGVGVDPVRSPGYEIFIKISYEPINKYLIRNKLLIKGSVAFLTIGF